MRSISYEFWQFNCWTFRVSFVVCTDSFVDSMPNLIVWPMFADNICRVFFTRDMDIFWKKFTNLKAQCCMYREQSSENAQKVLNGWRCQDRAASSTMIFDESLKVSNTLDVEWCKQMNRLLQNSPMFWLESNKQSDASHHLSLFLT